MPHSMLLQTIPSASGVEKWQGHCTYQMP
uniref:Uncharacterized protein n=1 Tax=Anguilla anguilla TaxID=7936 RepID=A0A0E9RDK5_ANGAN